MGVWPSGLRRKTQVLVLVRGRGFETHSAQKNTSGRLVPRLFFNLTHLLVGEFALVVRHLDAPSLLSRNECVLSVARLLEGGGWVVFGHRMSF